MNENNILSVVLAGGKSTRFGIDKCNAKLGDKTLLEHTISKIKDHFNEILVISNNKNLTIQNKKVTVVQDFKEGQLGPLIGVLTAMKWIQKCKKEYKWIATFPCDTPFFENKIISSLKLKTSKTSKKLIFLKSGERRHNIFGIWSLDLIETLEKDLNDNFRKVELWADKIGYETINIEILNFDTFLNINTQEDYAIAKQNLDKIKYD